MLEEVLEVVKANRDFSNEKFEEAEQKPEKVEPLAEAGKAIRLRNWEDNLKNLLRKGEISYLDDYEILNRIGLSKAGNHAARRINLRADLALFETINDNRVKEICAQEFERINQISVDETQRHVEDYPKRFMEAQSMRIEVNSLTHMDSGFLTLYQDALEDDFVEHEELFEILFEEMGRTSHLAFDASLVAEHNLYLMRCITDKILKTRKKIQRECFEETVTVS